MVRFSCFFSPNLHQKPKKVQHPGGTMHSTLQQKSEGQETTVNFISACANPEVVVDILSDSSMEQTATPSSHGDCWKSDHLNIENGKESLQIACMQKTKSLGSIIDIEIASSGGKTDAKEVDQLFSYSNSHKKSTDRFNISHVGKTSPEVHYDSIFSIEVLKQFGGNQHGDADEQSTYHISDSGCLSSDNHAISARSHSSGNLRMDTANSTKGVESHKMRPQTGSFENLCSLDGGAVDFHDVDDVHSPIHVNSYNFPEEYVGRKALLCQADLVKSDKSAGLIEGQKVIERFDSGNQINIDRFHSIDNITYGNEGEELERDDRETKNLQPASPIQKLDELNPKEYNIRRIEEWISQIDIENGCIVEEPGESSCSFSAEPQIEVSIPPKMPDGRSNLGIGVVNNHISSLTTTSLSAQMVNLGLVAIPILSAFTSLRVLNLSGNFIVRIAAGSLPGGLHMLNLSKNNIAIIEGLRDLTHLRILDLSYNRIARIDHGLASCSSLKEPYLAGNKISDVEGLHRLLKLNVLNLRGNQISTAKGLGQLAANYSSLLSINLEGNPAQGNVGDEQLRKYLLTLLPHLVHYNKQSLKASGIKETSDRSFPRSVKRTEHKTGQRALHRSGLHKLALGHFRTSHTVGSSLKQSRSQNLEGRPANLGLKCCKIVLPGENISSILGTIEDNSFTRNTEMPCMYSSFLTT